MSKYVQVKGRDYRRELIFSEWYAIKVKIYTTNYNDDNWDWDRVVLNFHAPDSQVYTLTEHFNVGKDNSTNFVELEYQGNNGQVVKKKFEKHLDAERYMVELIRRSK